MSLFTTYTTVMLAIQSRDFETAIAHFDADIVLHPATGAIPPLKGIEAVSTWLTGDHGLNKNQQWRAINYVESDELLMVEGVDEFDTPVNESRMLPAAVSRPDCPESLDELFFQNVLVEQAIKMKPNTDPNYIRWAYDNFRQGNFDLDGSDDVEDELQGVSENIQGQESGQYVKTLQGQISTFVLHNPSG